MRRACYDRDVRALAAALMFATACGRIGFDALPSGDATDATACTVPSPTVERVSNGTFVMGATEALHDEPIVVPLEHSMLFLSVREAEPTPDYGAIECDLTASAIRCIRPLAGTDYANSTGELFVTYTVVSFSSGVTVQRGIQTSQTPVPITPVPPESSFVLLAGDGTNNGNSWGTNEYQRATLSSSQVDVVELDMSNQNISWQVVTFQGASVERGTASLAKDDAGATAPLANAAPGSFPLVSYTSDSSLGLGAQYSSLLARIDQSSLVMERQPGGSPLEISWEVITLPFATVRGETALGIGQLEASVTVPGLRGATAAVIATQQAVLGQSGGSTTFTTTIPGAEDLVGEASGTLTPSDGQFMIQRSSALGASQFAWAAIDFSQPTCP
jgi:hypothetical protein